MQMRHFNLAGAATFELGFDMAWRSQVNCRSSRYFDDLPLETRIKAVPLRASRQVRIRKLGIVYLLTNDVVVAQRAIQLGGGDSHGDSKVPNNRTR